MKKTLIKSERNKIKISFFEKNLTKKSKKIIKLRKK